MKVLTQEEFDEKIKNAYSDDRVINVSFKNYILDNINVPVLIKNSIYIIEFDDCVVYKMIINDSIPWFGPVSYVIFNNCLIKDYNEVAGIRYCSIKNCKFETPVPTICPKEGEFIGYKKCLYCLYSPDSKYSFRCHCIVKLLIPADAKRSSGFGRKCRCSKATVLGIFDLEGDELKHINSADSLIANSISYELGKEVYPDYFDENRFNECSSGIHFFMTFKESKDYHFR